MNKFCTGIGVSLIGFCIISLIYECNEYARAASGDRVEGRTCVTTESWPSKGGECNNDRENTSCSNIKIYADRRTCTGRAPEGSRCDIYCTKLNDTPMWLERKVDAMWMTTEGKWVKFTLSAITIGNQAAEVLEYLDNGMKVVKIVATV